jgi:phosphopantothenate synthetase
MKTFTFAGTAREADGTQVFRATNRDGYAKILAKEGKTDINIQVLPYPMTKDQAKAYVMQGVTPAEANLSDEAKTVVVSKTPEQLAEIREKNLQTIKAVGKRYDQMAQRLAEMGE